MSSSYTTGFSDVLSIFTTCKYQFPNYVHEIILKLEQIITEGQYPHAYFQRVVVRIDARINHF